MPATKSSQTEISDASKVISFLQLGAKKVSDERIKKILLTAGCEIADLFLEEESEAKAA